MNTLGQLVIHSILILLAVSFAVAIVYAHLSNGGSKYKNFNILDLIRTRRGTISRPGVMEFGTWVLMCWGFAAFVVKGTLSEWYALILVGAFVVRGGFSSYLASKEKPK